MSQKHTRFLMHEVEHSHAAWDSCLYVSFEKCGTQVKLRGHKGRGSGLWHWGELDPHLPDLWISLQKMGIVVSYHRMVWGCKELIYAHLWLDCWLQDINSNELFPCEKQCRIPQKKLKIELLYDPAIPLLDIYLDKTIIWKDACTPVFIAALFTITKTWKQSIYLTAGWIKSISICWNIILP